MTQSKLLEQNELATPANSSRGDFREISGWLEHEIDNYTKHRRHAHGTKSITALNNALNLLGNSDLKKSTLLDETVHKKHADKLEKRLLRKLNKFLNTGNRKISSSIKFLQSKLGYVESPAHQVARKLIKFLTVVHAVESLNVEAALAKAKELKLEIEDSIRKVTGVACLGAIEVEVISINLMRRVADFESKNPNYGVDEDGAIDFPDEQNLFPLKEYRKLKTWEKLNSHLYAADIVGEAGQFLIHFHGVVMVKDEVHFDQLEDVFLKHPQWSKESRQVQLKTFSKIWAGSHKSIESSLKDIAYYITKGGIPQNNGTGYFKYKINIPTGLPMSYDEYLILNDQSNSTERQDRINNGQLLDIPNLSSYEISSLVQVVDRMMNWNSTRTGYLVTVGRW